jgi:3-hydroxyisobutyrate dehydrogenase-like beta-hydroxyacid dehydrogenase
MRYLRAMADSAGLVNPLTDAIRNSYAAASAVGGAEDCMPMLGTRVGRINGVYIAPSAEG